MAKGPMVRATTPVLKTDATSPGVFLQPTKIQPERTRNIAGAYARVMVDGEKEAEGIVWGFELLPDDEHTMEVQTAQYAAGFAELAGLRLSAAADNFEQHLTLVPTDAQAERLLHLSRHCEDGGVLWGRGFPMGKVHSP